MTMSTGWNNLFQNYSAITLHTSSWPARIPLTPGLVNLPNDPLITGVFRLGSLSALPEAATTDINAVFNEAREYLRLNSVRFAKLPGVRMVQLTQQDEVVRTLRGLREKASLAVTAYHDRYETMKAQHRPCIEQALFRSLKLDQLDSDDPAFERGAIALGELMAYVDSAYPTAREAAGRFNLWWSSPFKIETSSGGVDAESAAAEVEEVKNVLQGITEELRAELVKCVVEPIKRLLAKEGKITKRTTNSARETITRLRGLNIIGDAQLTLLLDQAELWCNRIDSDAAGAVTQGLGAAIEDIERMATTDIEFSVEQAEAALTSVGRRRLIMAPQENAA